MHFLVTGHTGFKGAWLSLLLNELGHQVSGISLDPLPGSLYELANLHQIMQSDLRIDVRDQSQLSDAFEFIQPDVVIHLAAQPLVRRSYVEPRFTIETNVIGTYNVLEVSQSLSSIKALVMVTTDKVYRNDNRSSGYSENDALGGDDLYSSSKAMADLLIQSWMKSFPGVPTAIVRGGNVIGGGDVSPDRLVVDLIAGLLRGDQTPIRYPDAIRPWQHVLDCLNGYLYVTAALLNGNEKGAGSWNIGPDERSFIPVREIANQTAKLWGASDIWLDVSESNKVHEASILALDANKARKRLGWTDHIPYPESLQWAINWAQRVHNSGDAREVTIEQIRSFLLMEDRSKLP